MTPPLKILLTTDTIGGVWTYCMELCRALPPLAASHRPVQIALATMGAPLTPAQREDLNTLPHVTLFESQYKLEWMPNPWQDVIDAGHWLLDIDRHFHPDIIHLNAYPHGSLDFSAPVLMVAHSCVLSWWQAVKSEPAPAQWDDYRRAVRNGLREADLVVAPSASMLQSVDALYGPLLQTRIIPNARDSSLFRTAPKHDYIFSAGRLWDEAKNVAALTRVAPRLPWSLNLAGDGGESLPANVHWLGRLNQKQMAKQLSQAAIYALPARYEPFGLSVLEAALSGCALVLGDIPSLRENWSGAASFVDPNDDDQLAHTLNELITNTTLRESLAAAALARSRRFTPRRFSSQYLSAYSDLLSPIQAARVSPDHLVERIPVCGS